VLYSTFARPASVLPEGAVRGLAELARSSWPLAAQSMIDLSGRDRPTDLNVRGARVIQESATGDVVASIVEATAATGDVVGLLSSIRAPALVIQATETQLFRVDMGQEIASRLPSSQLRLVQGAHNWLEPDAGRQVARAIDEFLGGGPGREDSVQADAPSPARQAPVFRAILFTDLVGHTQTMQRLGDARGRDLLREHERIMRDAFVRHAGTEIKSDGDSFMVSFASVTAAIECAIDIQRALHARDGEPLQARIGVNAGEPVEEEGDLFGAAVILAARVKDEANAGEILVPESVRGLVAGKGFAFAARGDFVPKGFEDAVRLFEVQWRE
jgi:class 3 adenylate cyclase